MAQNYVTGAQSRMARAALKLSVRSVATAANVSPNTVTRVEADLPVNTSTLLALRRAFETAGVEFREGGFVRLARGTLEDGEP